ncbi:MAG: hypothetical protein C4530_09210 [Desulfobacteraceae bacterium]|nr:MAG: hypothetical protein C4530_09210 [Desulfobacteraceae bacterium]
MIEYVRLRLTFEAVSDLQLTFFKGSTLRSLFKTSLRNICCIGCRKDVQWQFSEDPLPFPDFLSSKLRKLRRGM